MDVSETGGPSIAAAPFLDELGVVLARARAANAASLAVAARVIEDAVAGDGIVYVFGSGHSQLAALELNRRAGGLANVQVVFDPTWGAAELLEGYGETLVAGFAPGPADCVVVVSRSGVTPAPVAIALWARAHGLRVVAVTSVASSRAAAPLHVSACRLFELADAVLDNGGRGADASLHVAGFEGGLGPTSTIVAEALLHEVVVSAVAGLAARGVVAPVLLANAEHGGRAHNRELLGRYRGRLERVP